MFPIIYYGLLFLTLYALHLLVIMNRDVPQIIVVLMFMQNQIRKKIKGILKRCHQPQYDKSLLRQLIKHYSHMICSIVHDCLCIIQCQRLADLWQDDEGSSHYGQDNVDPKQPAEENEVGRHSGAKVTSAGQRKHLSETD